MISISCLIPIYNEEGRLKQVLDKVNKVKQFQEVICINDGSTDNSLQIVKNRFPNFRIVNLKTNLGKTEAIRQGLKKAKSDLVMLVDADLRGIKISEIEKSLALVKKNSKIDMLVLKRINSILFTKIFRGDILFTGERILRKKDLQKILKEPIINFQLEEAINNYMLVNNKCVYWTPFSALSTYKIQKRGFFCGLFHELIFLTEVFKYINIFVYIKQYRWSFGIKKLE